MKLIDSRMFSELLTRKFERMTKMAPLPIKKEDSLFMAVTGPFHVLQVDAKGGFSKRLFDLAYARRLSAINGSWFGACGLERVLWNFLVFRKVQAILGGRIRFILSGGAPLSADTQRFINICLGLVLSS